MRYFIFEYSRPRNHSMIEISTSSNSEIPKFKDPIKFLKFYFIEDIYFKYFCENFKISYLLRIINKLTFKSKIV